MSDANVIHGTLIAHQGNGCLIIGPSGSGKTRLALECMQFGAKFIADDNVQFAMNSGMLMGSPARGMAGVIELRGIGLVKQPDTATQQVIHLVAEITPVEQIERLPLNKEFRDFLGVQVPLIRIAPPPLSSGSLLLSALKWVLEGRILPTDWRPTA